MWPIGGLGGEAGGSNWHGSNWNWLVPLKVDSMFFEGIPLKEAFLRIHTEFKRYDERLSRLERIEKERHPPAPVPAPVFAVGDLVKLTYPLGTTAPPLGSIGVVRNVDAGWATNCILTVAWYGFRSRSDDSLWTVYASDVEKG